MRWVAPRPSARASFSGDPAVATTAAQWGLVNRAVPAERLDAEVADLVGRVTRGSAHGRTLGKHTFYAQVGLEQRQAYDLAVEVMAAAALGEDAQEGFAAFLQKRSAVFRSRP